MTAPLYRADVPLGLGLTATITIAEHDPALPPQSGAEWARELDWPIAELRIDLPAIGRGVHYPPVLSAVCQMDARVISDMLGETWGHVDHSVDYPLEGTATTRHSVVTERAEYLDDAARMLRARAESDLVPLIAHLARRAARLAEREYTLARGRAGRVPATEAERPIELDAAPRAIAPVDTDDDSSKRFALLEIEPKPRRRTKAA